MLATNSVNTDLDLFRQHGGFLRTAGALRLGIHPRTLYAMRDEGMLVRLSRGLYRLADLAPLSNPDLIVVAQRAPQSVICLVSALAFHGLTTQIPHMVDVAVRSGSARPAIDYPRFQLPCSFGNKRHWALLRSTHETASTIRRQLPSLPAYARGSLRRMA